MSSLKASIALSMETSSAARYMSHRFLFLLAALAQFFDSHGSIIHGLEVLDEGVDEAVLGLDGPAWESS
jgi:hypothetical protein